MKIVTSIGGHYFFSYAPMSAYTIHIIIWYISYFLAFQKFHNEISLTNIIIWLIIIHIWAYFVAYIGVSMVIVTVLSSIYITYQFKQFNASILERLSEININKLFVHINSLNISQEIC